MPASRPKVRALIAGLVIAGVGGAAAAQLANFEIPTDRVTQNAEGLKVQSTDPKWARPQSKGTLPEDWQYELAPGVTTRQISFYVDGGTRLYGKLYLPKGFDPKGGYPAVIVGHGINAISLGIEKYAARFAERGLVAMAIDYQSYGYSDSGSDELLLQEPDNTTDATAVTVRNARVKIKRTNLNNVHEIDAFRAAISYLQGEPGVNPEAIGVWATSNGGIVVNALIGIDGRVRSATMHVMGSAPAQGGLRPNAPANLNDAIRRVQTGQGGETTAGFSFPTNVDVFYNSRARDINGPATFDRVRPTTAVLYLPAERDELIPGAARGAQSASTYFKGRGVPSQTIPFPGLTHFQPYSGVGFEVGSNLAADWHLKHLAPAKPAAGR